MAFFDYRIFGASTWVFLDNFANLLWDPDWWRAWTSARYSFLVITMTFIPPVLLAILLQEVPRGKILFRLIFYLPASITGLVVVTLPGRRSTKPSEAGLLNRFVLHIPAFGWLPLALAAFGIALHLARRLLQHNLWKPALFVSAAGLLPPPPPRAPARNRPVPAVFWLRLTINIVNTRPGALPRRSSRCAGSMTCAPRSSPACSRCSGRAWAPVA